MDHRCIDIRIMDLRSITARRIRITGAPSFASTLVRAIIIDIGRDPTGKWHVACASSFVPLPADHEQWIPPRTGFLDICGGDKLGRAGVESARRRRDRGAAAVSTRGVCEWLNTY